MKYAIIADIHANLEAFDVVLRDQKEQGCTHIACLGDIVGYGPDPKECIDIVRALEIPTVKGNHDEYASMEGPLEGFNPTPAKAIEWMRNQLTEDDRKWLAALPYVLQIENFSIVHAMLQQPERWGYVFDRMAAAASIYHQNSQICFFGHTHVPAAFIKDTVLRGGSFERVKIKPNLDTMYFINPGSVGQSRDGIPKATYAIYDLDARTIELRRLDYDIATTQAKIRKTGLPPRL